MKTQKQALQDLAEAFPDMDLGAIDLPAPPLESRSDIIREAASVIAYFDLKEKFREETCRFCGNKFAYALYNTSVKCCSIPCMQGILQRMGLSWNPEAPLQRRWGQYVPAIVPAVVYELIRGEEQPPRDEETAPHINDETKNFIDELNSLI